MPPPQPAAWPIARLVSVATLVAVGTLAWSAWLEIRSGTRLAEQLMHAQAQSIADLVRESGTHGHDAYRHWEDEIAFRLFDNARWVARRDAIRPWRDAELAELAARHQLGRINLFDAAGRKTASSRMEPEESLTPRHDPVDFIAPVLRGDVEELRIGFKQARFRGGHRFAVAVARAGGGAVVVNVFADSMRTVLEQVRPGHLIGALATASGVRYVALQHGDSLVAATPETLGLSSLPPLPGPTRPSEREIRTSLGRVYEVVRPLRLAGVGTTVARIGLDPGPLDRARAAVRQRAFARSVLMAGVVALAIGLLLVAQRRELLAREVQRMRAELAEREAEVHRASRLAAAGELAAHVAHEIRNPLNTIHVTVQELERDRAAPAEWRARIADLRSESGRIERIVQQFLDLARPRLPQPLPIELHEAVAAAVHASEPGFRADGVAVVTDLAPLAANLDPQFVAEICDNLLRNARESSTRGDRVDVRLWRERGEAVLVVEDRGPGVPEALRERVFDLFYTTKRRGTGLGLSIVSRLSSAEGGGVRIEAREGGGARVRVHWPAKEQVA